MNDLTDSQSSSGLSPDAAPSPEVPSPEMPSGAEASPQAKPDYFPHGKQSDLRAARSLLFSHLGGILLALICCFSLSRIMLGGWLVLSVPLILLLYGFLVYGTMWGLGHEDANLANFGHITIDPFRGLKIGLLAMTPFLAFGVFFFLCYLFKVSWFPGLVIAYKLVNAEVWPIINAIEPSAASLADENTWTVWKALADGLLPLIPLAIFQVGYFLGTKDFSLSQKLVYKNKKSKKKHTPQPPKSQYTPSR